MPKKKDPNIDDEVPIDVLGLPHKKHKKHKHKKHKKRRGLDDDDAGSGGCSPGTPTDSFKLGLKLKIKIGGQTFGETRPSTCENITKQQKKKFLTNRVSKAELNEASSDESANIEVDNIISDVTLPSSSSQIMMNVTTPIMKKPKKEDEEDAWLAALEAGRLEEVDEELRRMKDPNLMTARQRSLLESKAQKEKEDITPIPIKEEKVLTEEMIRKKIIRAKKRKEQAEEKREKDKKQTIERLLKKTDAKIKGLKKLAKKADAPKIKYIDNQFSGTSLSFPVGYDYPLKVKAPELLPVIALCGVVGCSNRKKYSCSSTGVPLCSLQCYKKNLRNRTARSAIPVS